MTPNNHVESHLPTRPSMSNRPEKCELCTVAIPLARLRTASIRNTRITWNTRIQTNAWRSEKEAKSSCRNSLKIEAFLLILEKYFSFDSVLCVFGTPLYVVKQERKIISEYKIQFFQNFPKRASQKYVKQRGLLREFCVFPEN